MKLCFVNFVLNEYWIGIGLQARSDTQLPVLELCCHTFWLLYWRKRQWCSRTRWDTRWDIQSQPVSQYGCLYQAICRIALRLPETRKFRVHAWTTCHPHANVRSSTDRPVLCQQIFALPLQHRRGTVQPFDAHCYHIGTATKHPVLDRVKPSFVIFDIRALWRSATSVTGAGCQILQMTS